MLTMTLSVRTRHNVTEFGQAGGRAILFAHGFGCDQSMWEPVAERFAPRFRVVLFDHVGAGGSDLSAYVPEKYASLDGYASDIVELTRELGLEQVVYVGHSVSSIMGVLAARQAPGLFDKLVLVGPSPCYIDDDGYVGGFSEDEIHELVASLDDNYLGWSSVMAPVIMGNTDRPELGRRLTESFCRADPTVARQFAHVTFLSDNRGDLRSVAVPTLILQCTDDPIAPLPVGEFVHREIDGSTMVVLRATGHCPNLSAPDETYEAIRGFVESV